MKGWAIVLDQIKINNLEVFANHGVLKEENVLGQKFVISLVLFTDTKGAALSDDIDKAVDYASVSQFVSKKMKEKNYKLIETAAENLAEAILISYPKISKLILEIKKPWAPIMLPIEDVSVCIERGYNEVFLSVGSNLGDKNQNIKDAVLRLKQDKKIKNVNLSSLITTKPYGGVEQDVFLNGAISLETLYGPDELLEVLHRIEEEGKRERTIRWGPRTIDLDILFFNDWVVSKNDLIIPHIDMTNREFVLKPLSEIAPHKVHPVYNKTVMQLLLDLQ